jgi:hypothetical protein
MRKVRTSSGIPRRRIAVVVAVFLCHGLAIWVLCNDTTIRVASDATHLQIIRIPERGIGRIGPHGWPFEVGSYKIVVADSSGELFLGVNDNYYPDNTGNWVATLSAVSSPTKSAGK